MDAGAGPLPAEVAAAMDGAKLPHEALAVVVQEVGMRRARLEAMAGQPGNPASLMKLFTTFAALDLLGSA